MTLRAGSLCTGYGGLDMATEAVLGTELAWVADNDPGAAKILACRYPGIPNLGDIMAIDWPAVEPVDVLCAGFPCQDISTAGKRLGMRKGTRSGLWFKVARAIKELRPSLVVIENVKELLSERADSDMEPCTWCLGDTGNERAMRALGAVLADLATLGFDAEWTGVPAAGVGCCHLRWRIFTLAWPAADAESIRWQRHHGPPPATLHGTHGLDLGPAIGSLLPTPSANQFECDVEVFQARRARVKDLRINGNGFGLTTAMAVTELFKTPTAQLAVNGGSQHPDKRRGGGHGPTLADQVEHEIAVRRPSRSESLLPTPNATDGAGGPRAVPEARTRRGTDHGPRLRDVAPKLLPTPDATHGRKTTRTAPLLPPAIEALYPPQDDGGAVIDWRQYEAAVRRHEATFGVPAPCPVEPGRTGPRLAAPFVEWMMTVPAGWVTAVPGLSRNAQLKALGNGVAPPQGAAALQILLERAFGRRAA